MKNYNENLRLVWQNQGKFRNGTEIKEITAGPDTLQKIRFVNDAHFRIYPRPRP